jgi:hypothetical protein
MTQQQQPEWQPADKEVAGGSRSHMPAWMVIAGVAAGIAGAIIMWVASNRKESAESVGEPTGIHTSGPGFDSQSYSQSSALDVAVALGHFGLGVLIFGAALVLVGLTVVAVRR